MMQVEELLKLCWMLANVEAKNLGAAEIAPVHFLLGVMKIVDPQFPEQLEKSGVASSEWSAMCQAAQSIRSYIDVMPDKVTVKRRKLRARLAEERVRGPITAEGMLHRSEAMKRAFRDACLVSEGETLTLLGLVRSMFELELVTLDDIRG